MGDRGSFMIVWQAARPDMGVFFANTGCAQLGNRVWLIDKSMGVRYMCIRIHAVTH